MRILAEVMTLPEGLAPEQWVAQAGLDLRTSVEDRQVLERIEALRACGAQVPFISFEPLLGPMGTVDLTGISWAIIGGESGPGFRAMDLDWARELRDQCIAQDIPLWYKQSSGLKPEENPFLDSRQWHQFPSAERGQWALFT